MKTLQITLILFCFTACNAQLKIKDLKSISDEVIKAAKPKELTESDIVNGLKEALKVGSEKSSQQASQTDGFYKNKNIFIPFPKEVQYVADKLKEIGMEKQVNEFTKTLNRAAEEACKKSAPIFVNAIMNMTFDDARKVWKGSDSSATQFLRKKTKTQLFNEFKPVVNNALNTVGAAKHWQTLAAAYNAIPFTKKVETDLAAYTTNLAIFGLFYHVGLEEGKIRKDPAARISEILKRVFGTNG